LNLTPFDSKDRRSTIIVNHGGKNKNKLITPKSWFVLSVIGYCMQREMNPLALHIISFIGHGAKGVSKKSSSKKTSKNKKKKGDDSGSNQTNMNNENNHHNTKRRKKSS